MVSIISLLREASKRLKKIETQKFVQKPISIGDKWTAPHDGIVVCSRRSNSSSAYIFVKNLTLDTYVGMSSIIGTQNYSSISFPVVKGHEYQLREGYCSEPRDWYIYVE